MVDELSKKVITIPMCLCGDGSCGAVTYILPILLRLHVTISQDFLLMIVVCGTGCYLEVPVVGLPSPKGSANSFIRS